ncbi:hypothetical protein I33_2245 [Bacillus subtilis subsp. subtilis str. RO-NN-1]|nr:hypothetical protein I33_2245 [Bacillus subtilis subsp. subtilis str. RO-NN-1]
MLKNIRKLFIVSNNINSWRVQIERKLYKYKNTKEQNKVRAAFIYLICKNGL